MISYEQAQSCLTSITKGLHLPSSSKPFLESVGHICAQDIPSPCTIPPFDNAAMDGFAVRLSDIQGASAISPIYLQKGVPIAAGDSSFAPILQGQAIPIMTGAPIPLGTDLILPVEIVKIDGDVACISEILPMGAHIRRAGEDFQQKDVLIKKGTRVDPAHIMLLAAAGVKEISVFHKPRAVFIATGKELIDDYGALLQPGQIYNSNRPYAVSALEQFGISCVASYTVHDDPDSFSDLLRDIITEDIDMIISSGAVSAGTYDFVPSVLTQLGAMIHYHKVNVKPGKPNLCAQFPNGKVYFGLPGNPVATAIGLRFFVYPFTRILQGMPNDCPLSIKIAEPFQKKTPLKLFLKSKIQLDECGNLSVHIMNGQDSFMVHPFQDMNAWAVIDENQMTTAQGDLVHVYPLFPENRSTIDT